jgi:hypothetical protein
MVSVGGKKRVVVTLVDSIEADGRKEEIAAGNEHRRIDWRRGENLPENPQTCKNRWEVGINPRILRLN